jgi:hypothetical protein
MPNVVPETRLFKDESRAIESFVVVAYFVNKLLFSK